MRHTCSYDRGTVDLHERQSDRIGVDTVLPARDGNALMNWSNAFTVAARQIWEPAPGIASATAPPTGHGYVS